LLEYCFFTHSVIFVLLTFLCFRAFQLQQVNQKAIYIENKQDKKKSYKQGIKTVKSGHKYGA